MRIVWTIVAILLLGGLIVLFQPAQETTRMPYSEPGELPREAAPAAAPSAPRAAPTAVEPPRVTTPPPGETVAKKQPSAEPPPPAAAAIAAGSAFEPELPAIPQAELLPSKFVKLSDGSISVDDAWTIRGEGTESSPYEVSWEFLSSAQEDYMPRLGEKKLPARIAFLSGKRVKIAGYLAFPLVAPTSSECLLMLNQWDGCCIGIPPTPYDAVEVKLAAEIKGWKRHTINFGSIEGTFKVEPYLVENWLVGLYLIEGARIDTEL